MSWTINLSKDAAKQLRHLPTDRREQVSRALDQMTEDPMSGDVVPIKSGKFKGSLRGRTGRYRIIFNVNFETQVIDVGAILLRTEKTYR